MLVCWVSFVGFFLSFVGYTGGFPVFVLWVSFLMVLFYRVLCRFSKKAGMLFGFLWCFIADFMFFF